MNTTLTERKQNLIKLLFFTKVKKNLFLRYKTVTGCRMFFLIALFVVKFCYFYFNLNSYSRISEKGKILSK